MKLRVHQLAKELGYDSPKFLEKLSEIGVSVKSHLSGLTDEEIANIKRKLNKKDDGQQNKSNENHSKYVKETPNINKHDAAKGQNRVETNKKENEDKVELNVGLNNNSQKNNRNYQNRDNRDNRDGQRDRRSFERGKDDTRDSRNFGNRNNKKEAPKNDIAPSPIAEKPKNNVKGKAKFDKKKYEKEKKQKEEEKKLRELRSDFRKDDKKKKNKKKQEKVMKDEIIRIEGESIGMITIGEEIVIKDLAEKLGINVSDIIKKFFTNLSINIKCSHKNITILI